MRKPGLRLFNSLKKRVTERLLVVKEAGYDGWLSRRNVMIGCRQGVRSAQFGAELAREEEGKEASRRVVRQIMTLISPMT